MGEFRSELFVEVYPGHRPLLLIVINEEGNLPWPDHSPNIKLTSAAIK